jgi:SAM-dependent methyltransferase
MRDESDAPSVRAISDAHKWATFWSDPEAIATRLSPKLSDPLYLVLSDLRAFLQRFATAAPIRVLDYGAGASPYRELFPAADYCRADFIQTPGLDFVVGTDSRLPSDTGEFDLVLSTQVAEHLEQPKTYFREAWRVLRPGGTLIITTHGTWEEHGAPFDFQRWTTAGLQRDLLEAGIPKSEIFKLTVGDRAAVFLAFHWLCSLSSDRSWLCRKFAGLARRVARLLHAPANRCCDRWMPQMRVVNSQHLEKYPLYIILAAVAQKS